MIRVLRSKGCDPQCTLVEIDKVVLSWAMEFLEESKAGKVTPVCSDAKVFMAQNKAKFDLVFIDVFNGRVVPEFVYSELFLEQCRAGLEPGGYVAFNYMINDNEEWEIVKTTFTGIFPSNQILNIGINRILIGRIS